MKNKYTMSVQPNAAPTAAVTRPWAKRKQVSASIVLVENTAEEQKI